MMRSLSLFFAWALVGFVGSFALLYGFTPVGPLIVLIVWLAYRYLPRISGSRLPESTSAVAGLGAFWLFVATTVDAAATAFAAVGATAIACSVAGYLAVGLRRCRSRVTTV